LALPDLRCLDIGATVPVQRVPQKRSPHRVLVPVERKRRWDDDLEDDTPEVSWQKLIEAFIDGLAVVDE